MSGSQVAQPGALFLAGDEIMNTFLKYALLMVFVLGFGNFVVKAEELSPVEQKAVQAEAEYKAALEARDREEAMKVAAKKAEWNRKTWGEAMSYRAQVAVDYTQVAAGRTVEYAAYADGKAWEYAIVLPGQVAGDAVAYVAGGITTGLHRLEAGSKSLADTAFDNEPKQVAVKPEQK